MNDVDTFYKDCIFLYDDADGQPAASDSKDELVKHKLRKFKVNIESILEVSANCTHACRPATSAAIYVQEQVIPSHHHNNYT